MDQSHDHEITILIRRFREGDREAADHLLPLIYQELRRVAGALMRYEKAGHTLQPTALVHETYLRMIRNPEIPAEDRNQFKRELAHLMRQVLVDHARRRLAGKRGGKGLQRVEIDDLGMTYEQSADVMALHEGLDQLARLDARQGEMVTMAYFGGNSVEEIASLFAISPRTVKRELQSARVFLKGRLRSVAENVPPAP